MNPDPLIILRPAEARIAALVGAERMIGSLLNGNRPRPGIKPEIAWGINIEGAGAEMAFAKAMGWYWDGSVGVFHDQADVRHVHVRSTPWPQGKLIIRPERDVPGVYALVTGTFPRYAVRGWARWPGCPASEAAPDPGQPPALFVRQADLQPLGLLPREAA
jgi:hypothetical protein